jgi:hypothetical protein
MYLVIGFLLGNLLWLLLFIFLRKKFNRFVDWIIEEEYGIDSYFQIAIILSVTTAVFMLTYPISFWPVIYGFYLLNSKYKNDEDF